MHALHNCGGTWDDIWLLCASGRSIGIQPPSAGAACFACRSPTASITPCVSWSSSSIASSCRHHPQQLAVAPGSSPVGELRAPACPIQVRALPCVGEARGGSAEMWPPRPPARGAAGKFESDGGVRVMSPEVPSPTTGVSAAWGSELVKRTSFPCRRCRSHTDRLRGVGLDSDAEPSSSHSSSSPSPSPLWRAPDHRHRCSQGDGVARVCH